MQIYWSLLVCLVGLVLYLVLDNPSSTPPPSTLQKKVSIVGLHMFAGSTMATLLPRH